MSRRLDVVWTPAELSRVDGPADTTVVIDAIRATTCIATALAAGAARVVPVAGVDEARAAARDGSALLCGEREGLPPDGFDLGNSPGEFTAERVAGRPIVITTTNGTAAIRRALEAGDTVLTVACFRNLSAVAARAAAGGGDVRVVCAGRLGRVSMDDAWCAGHLVLGLAARIDGVRPTDGALAARALAERLGDPTAAGLRETAAGRALAGVGLDADLDACARLDDLDVAPEWREGAFVKGGEEAGT